MICMAVMLLLPCSGTAEGVNEQIDRQAGFDRMAEYAAEEGFDAWSVFGSLLRGDMGGLSEVIDTLAGNLLSSLRESFSAIFRHTVTPAALYVVLRVLLAKNPAALGMSNLMFTLCCAVALAGRVAELQQVAQSFLKRMNDACATLTPVMVSVASLTGAISTSSVLPLLSAEATALIQRLLIDVCVPLCRVACVVAVAGCLSRRISLNRLYRLLLSVVRWLLGGALFLFCGLISAHGLMGASRDTATVQTAKLALEKLVPVVGGEMSGSADSLAAGVGMIRRAVGFTGVALVGHMCFGPMLRLAAELLALKLAAAVLEPVVSDMPMALLLERLAGVLELLLAICACAAFVAAMLFGGFAALTMHVTG